MVYINSCRSLLLCLCSTSAGCGQDWLSIWASSVHGLIWPGACPNKRLNSPISKATSSWSDDMIAPCDRSISNGFCHLTMFDVNCISHMVRRSIEISLNCCLDMPSVDGPLNFCGTQPTKCLLGDRMARPPFSAKHASWYEQSL